MVELATLVNPRLAFTDQFATNQTRLNVAASSAVSRVDKGASSSGAMTAEVTLG
jgi:hypothetical protein